MWLRFYDQAGDLVALPEEAAQQQGTLQSLIRVLTSRFGEVPIEIATRLQLAEIQRLESLIDVAIAVRSFNEFASRLAER